MKKITAVLCGVMIVATLTIGCSKKAQQPGAQPGLSGMIRIDGSSTVFPITEAVAEEFQKVNAGVRVVVGISGTGGGFKRFVVGETDINDASRPIQETEATAASQHDIDFIELPVAYDGLSVVVHPSNGFATSMTIAELKKIWQPGSQVKLWSDVRAEWPAREIHLYGPGTDSGTFDYFTEAVVGEAKSCRADFTASEDDNVLVQGVTGDPDALGYFGYAYYQENKSRVKLVAVDKGTGAILPNAETIETGMYPLARPLLLYVNAQVAKQPAMTAFIDFYLRNGAALASEVGYIALPKEVYALATKRFQQGKTGSVFAGGGTAGKTLADMLRK